MKSLSVLLILLFSYNAISKNFAFQSTEKQTQVLELFTSEGCSSCPPADKWVSSLKNNKGLWKDFIPMALHVDYWDYIGWKDVFANARYSNRQRKHYRQGNISTVYTPCVLKAGKEWRAWRFNTGILPSENIVGILKAVFKDGQLKVAYDNQTAIQFFNLKIALLAMDVKSHVKAGENAGRSLKHDFVLLKHKQFHSNKTQWQLQLPESFFQSQYINTAVVIWVEGLQNLTPIQAVGGFID